MPAEKQVPGVKPQEKDGGDCGRRRRALMAREKLNLAEREPNRLERLAIDFLCEQKGGGLDQLAVVLGVEIDEMVRLAFEMKEREWIGTEELIAGTYPWTWVRLPGQRYSDFRPETGRVKRPKSEEVRYRWAANEARLRLGRELAAARWVPHASLRKDFRATRGIRVPAGLFETDGSDGLIRRRAVDVGWQKEEAEADPAPDPQFLEEALGELVERYDGVDFLCGPQIYEFLLEEEFEDRFDSLNIHLLAGLAPRPEFEPGSLMGKLVFQVKRGDMKEIPRSLARRRQPGTRKPDLVQEAKVVHKIDLADFPAGGIEEIALEIGRRPAVKGIWASVSGGARVYCVETDAGVFRAVKSKYGWRVKAVKAEAFDKKPPYILSHHMKRPVVHKLALNEMPVEIPRAIVEAGLESDPAVTGLWRKPGRGEQVYCVETTLGVYRVAGTAKGEVHARRFNPDEEYVKKPEPPPATNYPDLVEPEVFEISDALWARVEPMLTDPMKDPIYQGQVKFSNRAILSGVLNVLREEIQWRELDPELGYGGHSGCERRLRFWQRRGDWEPVRKVLEEGLPDGRELNWNRLYPKRAKSGS